MEESLWGENVLNDGQFFSYEIMICNWNSLTMAVQQISVWDQGGKPLITNILLSQLGNNISYLFAVINLRY